MAEKLFMLALSPTMEKGTIVNWIKKEGDEIAPGETVCEIETDKATMDYQAVTGGTLLKIVIPEGRSADVGETIGIVGKRSEDYRDLLEGSAKTGGDLAPEAQRRHETGDATTQPERAKTRIKRVPSSPLARKLAEENNLDLAAIHGTGPGGRIVKRDVEKAAVEAAPDRAATGIRRVSAAENVRKVSTKRAAIAKLMCDSKFSAPHYYLKISAIADGLIDARSALNAGRGRSVSLNSFLIKLASVAIGKHPIVNSTWKGDTIVTHPSIDIGLAVAQKDGLIAPVIRETERKGIIEIDDELRTLAEKARDGKLVKEEYSNPTFTISNLGSYGIEEFTAIINPPASAILAVGKIAKKTVVTAGDDDVEIRHVMKLTLSCDHRVIDGAEGAEFLDRLKQTIENPFTALY